MVLYLIEHQIVPVDVNTVVRPCKCFLHLGWGLPGTPTVLVRFRRGPAGQETLIQRKHYVMAWRGRHVSLQVLRRAQITVHDDMIAWASAAKRNAHLPHHKIQATVFTWPEGSS